MRKRHFLTLGFLAVALFIISVVVFPYALNNDSVKAFLGAKIFEAAGVEVNITGNIGVTFYPDQLILLEKLTIKNGGEDIASIGMAAIHMDILPFITGNEDIDNHGIDKIELFSPVLYVERSSKGRLNIEPLKKREPGEASFQADNIAFVNGSLLYSDISNGRSLKLEGLSMHLNDLYLDPAIPERAYFSGRMKIKRMKVGVLALSDLSMGIRAAEGVYNIDSFNIALLGGRGKGTARINLNSEQPGVTVRSDLSGLSLEDFSRTLNKKEVLRGDVDLSLDITMQAAGLEETLKTVKGTFDLSGESIMVSGIDIDDLLHNYRKTQNVDLLEVGTFLVAGPLGVIFNKGVELGGLYGAAKAKDGEVREFISSWEIDGGKVMSRDAAFATPRNRVALNGSLDLVNGTYEDFVVSVLDTDGCSEFTQRISGPLNDPQFEKLILKRSLFGPAISLIKKAGKLLSGGKCKPFYLGSVQHPEPAVQ